MALLVHLTSEKNLAAIKRSGIKPRRVYPGRPSGVFAMPVTRNFYISHQWLRELKRSGQRTIVAVYFRIDDDEPVSVGHYSQNHKEVSSAQAMAIILQAERAEGYEVIIPRRIEKSEIHRIRQLSQVLGWRYMPGAHGRKPCGCPICLPKGTIRSQKIRKKYEDEPF